MNCKLTPYPIPCSNCNYDVRGHVTDTLHCKINGGAYYRLRRSLALVSARAR